MRLPSLLVDLVEGDFFGFRRGRIERDGTDDERKAQQAFPISVGGIRVTPLGRLGLKANGDR